MSRGARTRENGSPPRPPEGLLERSAELAALEDAFAAAAAERRGRLVLVAGEAGIGKTALVEAFCGRRAGARVLSGACEALHTPRALGPLLDIAAETGGELARLVEAGCAPTDALPALLAELRRGAPAVVVLEDLHWADEATLDLLRLLARRVAAVPALVVATYRDDELERHHQLRVVLGELPQTAVTRLALPSLSTAAVARLAQDHGVDPHELHRTTGGNPFFVTEVLAGDADAVPDSVRDAVLARAARLGAGARALLDVVAVTPPRLELWLLEALAEPDLAHLEECLASGMLRAHRDAVAFRHEIARVAIEEAMPPDRAVALHRAALRALADGGRAGVDLARLAHHADAAGDGDAVLRYAPAAGRRASALGAHREAAAQFARALRFAGALPSSERAELLEQHSYECYLTNAVGRAVESRRAAIDEHVARGDRLREGDARRWLSRFLWYAGDTAAAEVEARAAVALLEPLPEGPELAMAYSNVAQLRMLASDLDGPREWGLRAIELAERLGETGILAHALNNLGATELLHGQRQGVARLERSLELALAAGLDDDVVRAYTNLATSSIERRDHALGGRALEAGIAFCRERDLDSYLGYLSGWRARSLLDRGLWDDAGAVAAAVLGRPTTTILIRILPLVVSGLVAARRGEAGVWERLDEARELAESTGELQRLAPVAAARAEARWLAGEPERVREETDGALALARHPALWAFGELRAWRHRAGIDDELPLPVSAEPFRLELEGDREGAAAAWRALGCPYDAALVLLGAEREADLRWSLEELQRLGARPAAARASRALRERGVRGFARGPRPSTRRNAAGLTARELEVLELVAAGLRNAQIAARLVVTAKTVDHHVSAILRKLDAATRTEAAARAKELGLLEETGPP